MSSTASSILLRFDPGLRRLVLYSGTAAALMGLIVIALMPLEPGWRVGAGLLWLFFSLRELHATRTAYRYFSSLQLDQAGGVELIRFNGERHSAVLLSSSVVLPGLAWLRFRPPEGLCFGELLCGNCREDQQWRRLQVIWRHLGAAT